MGEAATPTLPEEILTAGPGRVRALVVSGGNPVAALPDPQTAVKSFRALDLLVALEPMMTATARLAHYILPPPVMFERPDLTWTLEWVNLSVPYAQYTPALVPPPPGAQLCDESYALWSILKRLGKTIRFNGKPLDMTSAPTEDDLLAILTDGDVPLADIKAATAGRLFAVAPQSVEGPGPSAGRFEVMPPDVAAELESYRTLSTPAEGFGLRLISRRMREVSNSTLHDLPAIRARVPYNPLQIHPEDLKTLGIADGERVRVVSRQGSVPAIVRADATLKRGVVSMSHSWGSLPDEAVDYETHGASIATLLSLTEGTEPLQAMPLMSGVPVRIEMEHR
jgi:anaerobic selenocysteine-containing dehydrogenase